MVTARRNHDKYKIYSKLKHVKLVGCLLEVTPATTLKI